MRDESTELGTLLLLRVLVDFRRGKPGRPPTPCSKALVSFFGNLGFIEIVEFF